MFNTIILRKGNAFLTNREYKTFEKGSTIYGPDREGEEIKRWNIDDKDKALAELNKYVCEYRRMAEGWRIEEYVLEYCRCDEEGEFVEGSDYDFAKGFLDE